MKRCVVILAVLAAGLVGCEDTTETVMPTTFDVVIENVAAAYAYPASGAFTVPEGASEAGPIGPGEAFEVVLPGLPGDRLSFATMFAQSNDFFYAPAEEGIALYDGQGTPVSGDVTDQVMLWDAGTEVNQEPGLGPDQAPRQEEPNTGADDPDDTVRLAADAFGNLPAVPEVIQVTLTPNDDNTFTLRIENVSTGSTLSTSDGGSVAVPLSPGVWVNHEASGPLFTAGMSASAGLEALAEDGDASTLADALAEMTGTTTALAPGAWAVVDGAGSPFYTVDDPAGPGLEALAEDGVPAELAAELMEDPSVSSSGVFDTPDGADAPGPLLPGESYSFSFEAGSGEYLQLATMYVESNDLFYALPSGGSILFVLGTPVDGDITSNIRLFDAGTEVNQWPGFGPDQAPRQAGPDTGEDEVDGAVARVSDGYDYGAVEEVIRVTLTPRS